MTEKQRETIEGLDWQIHECQLYGGAKGYELEKYSPAGEDFIFAADDTRLAESIREYAADFDPDEHAEMWVRARYEGKDQTIPSIRELIEDADAINLMLQELAAALSRDGVEEENEDQVHTHQQPSQREDSGYPQTADNG